MANGSRSYGSRKFVTTNVAMAVGAAMLIFGVMIEAPEGYWSALPGFFILLAAGIGAYNWSNTQAAKLNGKAG